MVEGPHPVGLSDIKGGSNLAAILVSFFTLKLETFFSQPNTQYSQETVTEYPDQPVLCTCDMLPCQPDKMAAAYR